MKVINTYFVLSTSLFGGDVKRVFELENGDYVLESNPIYYTIYEKITKEQFEKLRSNWEKLK